MLFVLTLGRLWRKKDLDPPNAAETAGDSSELPRRLEKESLTLISLIISRVAGQTPWIDFCFFSVQNGRREDKGKNSFGSKVGPGLTEM